MPQNRISEFRSGQFIEGTFLLGSSSLNRTSRGNPYLHLVISDRTGRVPCKMWNATAALFDTIRSAEFVKLTGRVETYQGNIQIVSETLEAVDPKTVNPVDFLPVTPADRDEMDRRFAAHVDRISVPCFRELIEAVFGDGEFYSKFRTAPAAKEIHHAYIGGLIEHTLSITDLSSMIGNRYDGLDQDMLRVAALLHDVGKVDELKWHSRIDYTDKGRLIGHIILGWEKVGSTIDNLSSFPALRRDLLQHMILSHHGQLDWGSPVKPVTPEAIALHYLDDLDAKVNAFQGHIEDHGRLPGNWTEYHRIFERFIFKGDGSPASPGSDGF